MMIEVSFITGMMLGFEYVQNPEDEVHYLVVDLLFVRFLCGWQ